MKRALLLLVFVFLVARAKGAYVIVQSSGYHPTNTTDVLASNQTAGNTNIVAVAFCPNVGCTSATCQTTSLADTKGNSPYVMDQNAASTQILCVDIGRFFNIAATIVANTVTQTVSGTPFYTNGQAIEVSGLGTSPSFESSGTNSGSGLTSASTGGSCTAGDFAISYWYSNNQPSAGSGWTPIGTPGSNQVLMWQTVGSTGIVTATVTGTGTLTGGSVVCYKPTAVVAATTSSLVLLGAGAP
jgi:hypothetical protein